MPRIVIKSGLTDPNGVEEELAEYICDTPGCPNVATHVLGRVPELGLAVAVCEKHIPPQRT